MTREEMICIIDRELIQRLMFESHVDDNGAWDSYAVAEIILSEIEKAGMVPPAIDSNLLDNNGEPLQVHDWEQE